MLPSLNASVQSSRKRGPVDEHEAYFQRTRAPHIASSTHSAYAGYSTPYHPIAVVPAHALDFLDPALRNPCRDHQATHSRGLVLQNYNTQLSESDCFRDLVMMCEIIDNCAEPLSRILRSDKFDIDSLQGDECIHALYRATDRYTQVVRQHFPLSIIPQKRRREIRHPTRQITDYQALDYLDQTQRLGPYPNLHSSSVVSRPCDYGGVTIHSGAGENKELHLVWLCFQNLLRMYDTLVSTVLDWHHRQGRPGFVHYDAAPSTVSHQSVLELDLIDRVSRFLDKFGSTIGLRDPSEIEEISDNFQAASSHNHTEECGGFPKAHGMHLAATRNFKPTIVADDAEMGFNIWATSLRSLETSLRRNMHALRILFLESETTEMSSRSL